MKKISLIISFVLFTAIGASAQIEKPVTWSYVAKKISKTEAVVYIKATMEQGWHIYSQNLKAGGPQPTSFSFAASKDYTPVGKTTEPKATTYFDENFKMNVSYFGDKVVFQQKIKLNKPTATVKGKVEFMVCNDEKCLPPEEVSFSIPVK
ncbi:protein-disulfide reductase DsbD N-terminal domain-containing protein [Pedobacter sp. PLR]|uniref:protein-disulfide reductase DsbD N-terminal domain-containing protein n=1 Tax=Pedobacter sp. PLR TaxID=2994465 RepID=UPI0022455BF4|nr:protein-disulfide reductase DsbD N-terminal domain-containing protein [Pedobacter sp. PLR]MCX2452965.1 protein-disulfide reductase DsbD N-terminal domain-containing protein [Pedobacter sp. PLR]